MYSSVLYMYIISHRTTITRPMTARAVSGSRSTSWRLMANRPIRLFIAFLRGCNRALTRRSRSRLWRWTLRPQAGSRPSPLR